MMGVVEGERMCMFVRVFCVWFFERLDSNLCVSVSLSVCFLRRVVSSRSPSPSAVFRVRYLERGECCVDMYVSVCHVGL